MVVSRQRPGLRRLPRRPSPTDGMGIRPGARCRFRSRGCHHLRGVIKSPQRAAFSVMHNGFSRASSRAGPCATSFLFARPCSPRRRPHARPSYGRNGTTGSGPKTFPWSETEEVRSWPPLVARTAQARAPEEASDEDEDAPFGWERHGSLPASSIGVVGPINGSGQRKSSAMSNRAEVFSSCRGRLANLEIERQGQWSIDPQEQGGNFGKRTGLMLPRPADAQLKWRTKHAA